MKKGFFIELKEALEYPCARTICEAIGNYCAGTHEMYEFASREKPITFYLDSVLYSTQVDLSRGGYVIHCKEL